MKKSFVVAAISLSALLSSPSTNATTVDPTQGDTTWTLVSRLGQVSDETTPIPVFNSDESGGTITLSSANNYRVAENLVFPIVISADEVCLDLNCKKISSNDGSQDLITVNSGLKYINIHNGRLINTDTPTGTGAGILIQNGSSVVQIEKVKIIGCGNGVKLDGQDGNEVIECELIALDLISNTTGLVLSHADENVIKDCTAFHNTQAGFELLNSEANCFYDCQALKTFGNQSTMGFTSRDGKSNLFQRCVAKKTKTSAFEFCNKAHGFLLTGTEEKTKIIDCIVNETDVTSTVSAIAYGIHLAPILLEGSDLLNFIDGNNTSSSDVRSVAWSPDSNFIVSGDEGGFVRVFRFDGTNLIQTASDNTPGAIVRTVAWSPDGTYIASGDEGDFVRVFRFDGTDLIHTDSDNTPGANVTSVAWSSDGNFISSGDDGDFVRVFRFDGTDLTQTASDSTPSSDVRSVAWSPDGNFIASGDRGNFVRVFSFDGSNLTHIDNDNTPGANIVSVAWSPDGSHIASGDRGNFVRIFSFDGTDLIHTDSDNTPGNRILSVAWSPDGKYIASADENNFVRIFSFDGSNLTHIKGNNNPGAIVRSVAWSSDGNFISSGDDGEFVRVFDAMFGPESCLVDSCRVCDTAAYNQFVGTGIAGGGNNFFVSNVCCNNEVNYTYGIPNVYYGRHNIARDTVQPFDNISMPTTQ